MICWASSPWWETVIGTPSRVTTVAHSVHTALTACVSGTMRQQRAADSPPPANVTCYMHAERFKLLEAGDCTHILVIEGALPPTHAVPAARAMLSVHNCPLRAPSLSSTCWALHPAAFRHADEEKGRIIAAGTLLLEHKFIRGCGTAGHIEDVVVDSSYRGLRLGAR